MAEDFPYVKWYKDPDLEKDWKNFQKKFPYMFWMKSMLIPDGKAYRDLVKDRMPEKDHPPKEPRDEDEYIEIASARRDLYFEIARAFMDTSDNLTTDILSGTYQEMVKEALGKFFYDERLPEALNLLDKHHEKYKNSKARPFKQDLDSERFVIFEEDTLPFISGYESIYRSEKQIMGDLTADVKKFYNRAGYDIDRSRGNIPPDEFKLELEFMYLLNEEEIDALREGRKDRAKELINMQKEFLQNHMFQWISFLCDDLTLEEFKRDIGRKIHKWEEEGFSSPYEGGITQMDFFRAMGIITKALIEHDYRQVEAQIGFLDNFENFSPAKKVNARDTSNEMFHLKKVS